MKCFYHSADLDGHCSGAVVKHRYPGCEMIGINYGQEFPWEKIEPGEIVFMVDFSLQPFSDMFRLARSCGLFIWIDHHKTAIEEAERVSFELSAIVYHRIGRGACETVWDYLFPESNIPYAVKLLSQYDVWNHSDEATLPFQYGFRMFPDTRPENQELWEPYFVGNGPMGDEIVEVVERGSLLLRYEEQQNAKFCKAYAFETVLIHDTDIWLNAICANRGFTNSKVFDSVYDPSRHDLMITFCRLKPPAHKWTVSLYSTKPDIDCGDIARTFGGGGHKGAAGFQCEELPFEH